MTNHWTITTGNLFVANNVTTGKFIMSDALTGKNTFYHNNFQNLAWNSLDASNSVNTWSINGQGNYWSDNNGTDANHDGISDTRQLIDTNNVDNYPLMYPITIQLEKIPAN